MKNKIKYYQIIWRTAKEIHQGKRIIANFEFKQMNIDGAKDIIFYNMHSSPDSHIVFTIKDKAKKRSKL